MLLEADHEILMHDGAAGVHLYSYLPDNYVLISENLLLRKIYFDSNIVRNKNVRILRRFPKDAFEADVERSIVYRRRHQGAKC